MLQYVVYLSEKIYEEEWAKYESKVEWNETIVKWGKRQVGGCGGQRPPQYTLELFFGISFLRVNINTILYNLNFDILNILFPCSRGRRQLVESR